MAILMTRRLSTLALTAVMSMLMLSCQSALAAHKSDTASTDVKDTPAVTAKAPASHVDSAVHDEHAAKSSKVGKVACMNAHAACAESEKVIETLKHMSHLYSEGKFDEFSQYIDDGITTFDERNNKLIVGKQAVVDDIKSRWSAAHSAGSPIVTYTINRPYAQVQGDQAVVTFEAVKTVGGKNPETMVSRCTDIFVKRDGTWKKMHYRSCWKKGKAACGT